MRAFRWPLETIHLLALGLWLGTLVMTGVAAAITFPTVRDLDPTLATHASYTGDHWLIIAGRVANTVFLFSDAIQFLCAAVAGLTMLLTIAALGEAWRRPAVGVRVLAVFSAITVFAWSFFVLREQMNGALNAYWSAAAAGENEAAAAAQAEFDALHPTATALLSATLGCVLAAMIAGVASLRPIDLDDPASTGNTTEDRPGDPVVPTLAKGPRR